MVCFFESLNTLEEAAPFLKRLDARLSETPESSDGQRSLEESVLGILQDVRQRGVAAVLEFTRRFDSPQFTKTDFLVPFEKLERAAEALPPADLAIILDAVANIREFHEHQKRQSWFMTRQDGSILGQRVSPVSRAGLYVPGGQGGVTPLVSSLLMAAIPAQVAGVEEVVMVSPPRSDGSINPYLLGMAYLLGIKEVYAVGSAWGIAALAYGAEPLRAVDVIVGPGNKYVATAKKLLIGTVGIDMLAGPSEVLIVADDKADPAWVAADMLAQAEHDADAAAICLCFSTDFAEIVQKELVKQVEVLPRKETATLSLQKNGLIAVVPDYTVAASISNAIAPEHLELMTDSPWEVLPLFTQAGAVFMGYHAAESLGDYFAGPNHVLPTMRTARFSSALGVHTFCKQTSLIAASPDFAMKSAQSVARLARIEGLEGHARSALIRLPKGYQDSLGNNLDKPQ